jgi:hypothetical protein
MKIQIELQRPRWFVRSPRWAKLLVVASVALLVVAVPVAWASDRFTDVPTTNPHHDDISTIARAGITLGCNPPTNDQYCPEDPVTRQQMASFLGRTLRALTPVFRHAESGISGALDFDAQPVVCQTTVHTPTVAEHARIDSWLSANSSSSGLFAFALDTVYSTNDGVTWVSLDSAAFSRAGRTVVNEWAHANQTAQLNLTAGTSYRFGLQVQREAGTVDATEYRCEVLAEISYRDAGASSLGVSSATATGSER